MSGPAEAGADRIGAPPGERLREMRANGAVRVALMGMSGVGKTRLSTMLRRTRSWFHYSVDYRIGTRHLGDEIADELKREAMRSPILDELLRSDSIFIGSNLSVDDLAPLSRWLGLPGAADLGGLAFDEYVRRQRLHRAAELAAMADTPAFVDRASELYGYPHFLCDTSGSLVEIVDPDDRDDPVMSPLADRLLFVLLDNDTDDADELARRYDSDPKPIYFDEAFLTATWEEWRASLAPAAPETCDPKAFMRFAFRRLVARRGPRYRAIAQRWGLIAPKSLMANVADESDFLTALEHAADRS